jgi:hypothetical protein
MECLVRSPEHSSCGPFCKWPVVLGLPWWLEWQEAVLIFEARYPDDSISLLRLSKRPIEFKLLNKMSRSITSEEQNHKQYNSHFTLHIEASFEIFIL